MPAILAGLNIMESTMIMEISGEDYDSMNGRSRNICNIF